MNLEDAQRAVADLTHTRDIVFQIMEALDSQGFLIGKRAQELDVLEGSLTTVVYEGLQR